MSISRPFYRTVRQHVDGNYTEGGRWEMVRHPKYCERPERYVRGFLLIQQDLQNLFEFIEPDDRNLQCHSFRVLELLIRSCVEVESNCKAILWSNAYGPALADKSLNLTDYCKIEQSHFLSGYEVRFPYWTGQSDIRRPFGDWGDPPKPEMPRKLDWYSAYNQSKHDRVNALHAATLSALLDAVGGLFVLLTAQFLIEDFSPGPGHLLDESGPGDGFEYGIGSYLQIRLPDDVPHRERYDFDWQELSKEDDPFERFPYS